MSAPTVVKRFYSENKTDMNNAQRFARALLQNQTVLMGNQVFEPTEHKVYPDGIKFVCIAHGKLSHPTQR